MIPRCDACGRLRTAATCRVCASTGSRDILGAPEPPARRFWNAPPRGEPAWARAPASASGGAGAGVLLLAALIWAWTLRSDPNGPVHALREVRDVLDVHVEARIAGAERPTTPIPLVPVDARDPETARAQTRLRAAALELLALDRTPAHERASRLANVRDALAQPVPEEEMPDAR